MTTTAPIAHAVRRDLRALRGDVVGPEDPEYDRARTVYNAMIDRRPGAIVRCADAGDVAAAVRFAAANDVLVAVRGGGHNGGGLGVCDDGIVIDLSGLRDIAVDPARRAVRVDGGCLWREVDAATHEHGLATPCGIIGSTGVGGLSLGGGVGHLSRRHGLTVDNLLEAEVVLATGERVTAGAGSEPDLFWAIRGGGGNFGVVTRFTFRAHPVSTVVAGPTFWSLDDSAAVMRWYDRLLESAARELNGFFAFLTVPPAPPFPEHLHGLRVCGVVWCHSGDPEAAEAHLADIVREPAEPLLHGPHPMPLPALNTAFDDLYPPGLQWYWRADFVDELPDAAIERHVEHAHRMPAGPSTMHLYPIDGAVHDVGAGDTAWSHRSSRWAEVIVGVDPDPANAGLIRDWTVDYWEAVHPHSAGGAYVNFLMDEGEERVRATYRGNHDRLAAVKARLDPANLFRVNQNIRPEPAPAA